MHHHPTASGVKVASRSFGRRAAVAALLLAASCSGKDVTPPRSPAEIVLSTESATLRSLGESIAVVATVKDQHGDVYVATVTWSTADPNIATVSNAGSITAVGNGTTSVTARSGNVSKSISVTIRQEPKTVTVTPAQLSLSAIGATAPLTAEAKDGLGRSISDMPPTWTSSAPNVVTVAPNGVVTAVGNGTSTLTATVGASTGTASVSVSQQATQLTVSPPTLSLLVPGPPAQLSAVAVDSRGNAVAVTQVTWASSNETVATVSSSGLVTGFASGTATISAQLGSLSSSAIITVKQDGTVAVEAIDPFLAAPAANHQWEIPVLVIRYLPTTDGVTLDQRVTAFPFPATQGLRPATLSDVRSRIDVYDRRVKFMLEEGSRFRGYANAQALPALGYRILHYVTVYEALPLGRVAGPCPPNECTGDAYFPDYHAILARVNAQHWVNTKGVKEIWVWGYHYGNMVQPESNMSSPTTGDISNSFRWNDDLPIYNTTYTLYGYNYSRTQNEAVHNHGHQLEAILGYADGRRNGNDDLFWKSFVGRNGTTWMTGRAGWTHMPPNTTQDYDYLNPNPVLSDIEDWRPDNTGTKSPASSNRWRNLVYAWPSGTVPLRDGRAEEFQQGSDQRTEAQWYVYWMQNMPGRGSAIPHFGGQMTNWWTFTANWDAAITAGTSLSTVPNGLPIAIRNDYLGSVLLDPGGDLSPGQTRTLFATAPVTVRVWDCGEPGGCKMDPYVLTPGKNYRIITHPNGPPANLTIVEQ